MLTRGAATTENSRTESPPGRAGDGRLEALRQRGPGHQRSFAVFPALAAGGTVLAVFVDPDRLTPAQLSVALGAAAVWLLCAGLDTLTPVRLVHRSGLATWWPLLSAIAGAALWAGLWSRITIGPALIAFPVILSAFVLRRTGALVVGTAGILAGALVVLTQAPTVPRTVEQLGLLAGIAALAALLVRHRDENERLVHRLEELASVDTLTGLVTRRVLDGALTTALSSLAPGGGTALVLVDLDRFKAVNDDYGHPVGDAALRHVATVLTTTARDSDVVARLGGDELALMINGCAPEDADRRARLIHRTVRDAPLRLPDGRDLVLTVSVGVAHVPAHAHDLSSLYRTADSALYAAKRAGRDRVMLAG